MANSTEIKISLVDTREFHELVSLADRLLITARAVVRENPRRFGLVIRDGLSPAVFEMNKAIEEFDEWSKSHE